MVHSATLMPPGKAGSDPATAGGPNPLRSAVAPPPASPQLRDEAIHVRLQEISVGDPGDLREGLDGENGVAQSYERQARLPSACRVEGARAIFVKFPGARRKSTAYEGRGAAIEGGPATWVSPRNRPAYAGLRRHLTARRSHPLIIGAALPATAGQPRCRLPESRYEPRYRPARGAAGRRSSVVRRR